MARTPITKTLVESTHIFGVQVLYYSDGTSVIKQYNSGMEGFSIPVGHHIGLAEASSVVMTALRMEHADFYNKNYARPGEKT